MVGGRDGRLPCRRLPRGKVSLGHSLAGRIETGFLDGTMEDEKARDDARIQTLYLNGSKSPGLTVPDAM